MTLKRLPFLQTLLAAAATPAALSAATPTAARTSDTTLPEAQPRGGTALRFYALDGGRLDFANMGAFCDTGENEGKAGTLAVPCYLIQHREGWILWDTGLGDKIASKPNGETHFGGRFTVRRTLASQLAELRLRPNDIRYVMLSHLHADHSGNIDLFPNATFLVASSDLTWARGIPTPPGIIPSLISPLLHAHVDDSDDDRDIFGDGSVRILKAPGHTPGHRMLLVKLRESGPMLVTGDLYHTRENYEKGLVPGENTDRADTLASFNRFAGIKRNNQARVIVQHSPEDFAALPTFPKYLE